MSSIAEGVRFRAVAAGFLVLAAIPATAIPAAADAPPFRDDRSGPAEIVASLYDALDRHEYARAWSYFGEEKPVADYATFVKGYADTESIALRTGAVTTEGAAGSVYGAVPVAIAATASDGTTEVFAGCYTTRQVRPAIQEPPFRPLEIVAGELAPSDAALDAAVPADCPAP